MGEHDLVGLAGEFGTPLYVTDESRILDNYTRYLNALTLRYSKSKVLYAAKANGNLALLRALGRLGAGADVFSSGELELALSAGMKPAALLFNGSSKSPADLSLAVEKDVTISVDSLDELHQLDRAAATAGKTARISFRVNPALHIPTHPKIATGVATSKFGIAHDRILAAYREALACRNVRPVGVHCHIGSQILEVEPFARAAAVMVQVATGLTEIGVELEFIDLGGRPWDPVPPRNGPVTHSGRLCIGGNTGILEGYRRRRYPAGVMGGARPVPCRRFLGPAHQGELDKNSPQEFCQRGRRVQPPDPAHDV